jgi:ferritin
VIVILYSWRQTAATWPGRHQQYREGAVIGKKLEKAINGQINNEMYSAYLYMAMSAHADSRGLKGFAKWFMVQYHEEMVHAMKMLEFVQSRNWEVKLGTIKEPPSSWKTPLEMFEKTLEHEQFITKCINDLVALARTEKDNAGEVFYQWYVTEQVEEEQNDNDIINMLKMAGDSMQGLMMVDAQLATRMVTVPTNFSLGVAKQMKAAG